MNAVPQCQPEAEPSEAPEPGYAEWKRAKVERGLAQTRDREAMIPAERIWRDLS